MSDPIRDALAEVEVEEEHDDPGAGFEEIGEEPDARPEGPTPDADADDLGGDDEGGFSVLSWARSVPEGSHTNFDKSDWWDPEGGGETRLAFHLSDAAGEGVGYPNGLGTVVALAELYWSQVKDQNGGGSSSDDDEQDAPDAETVDRETAEAHV